MMVAKLDPEEVLERIFPGPSPVSFLMRRAVQEIVRASEAAEMGTSLLQAAQENLWNDLPRLWTRETLTERRILIASENFRRAHRLCWEAGEDLREARTENDLLQLAERSLERQSRHG
jgi:hypothetical protein